MTALITPEEVSQLSRPCYADEDIVRSIIAEAEREDIKPRIGDQLYMELKKEESRYAGPNATLMNGGSWTDCSGKLRYLEGLKTALAYFVYARIVRDGNIQSTRYGARIKTEDHSYQSENEERQRQYRQVFASADAYMVECLAYINRNAEEYGIDQPKTMRSNRSKFKVLNGRDSVPAGRTVFVGGGNGNGDINIYTEDITFEGDAVIVND